MTSEPQAMDAHEGRLPALREAILQSFPPKVYSGKVTHFDGVYDPNDEDTAALDDDQFLFEALQGRQWTEVPRELLETQPDGFVLLTDEAFKVFLAAWLVASLERMDGENEVRNFVVFAFARTMRQFRVLNVEQRQTVRSLFLEFERHEISAFVRTEITKALDLIDGLGIASPS